MSCVLCCGVCGVVWCDTLKTSPCVHSIRPLYAGTKRTCVSTYARGAGIHGDVLNVLEQCFESAKRLQVHTQSMSVCYLTDLYHTTCSTHRQGLGTYSNFCPAPHQVARGNPYYHSRVIAGGDGHLFFQLARGQPCHSSFMSAFLTRERFTPFQCPCNGSR